MPTIVNGISGDILQQYIERIERLEIEKNEIAEQIRDVFIAAKNDGFEPKVMRKVISVRKMNQKDLDEQETLFEIYKRALGMTNGIED